MLYRIYNKITIIISDLIYLINLMIKVKNCREKKLFLIGTPEYHNIGDIAIMLGEINFLEYFFNRYALFEITMEIYNRNKKFIRCIIEEYDIILITGGGFLGNVWTEGNDMVIDILKYFKKNKVIILPSTIFYTNDDDGNKAFEKDRDSYQKHENLLIILREAISYENLKNNINLTGTSKQIIAPDMALYLNYPNGKISRDGVLLCFRNDKEKKITDVEYETIIRVLKEAGYNNFIHTDTAYQKRVKRKERELLLNKKVNEFIRSELVITDRLHGIIVCVITQTPCIAITSVSHKLLGVYEWFKDIPFIQFVKSYDKLQECIIKATLNKDYPYKILEFQSEFKKLADEIECFIERRI